MRRGSWDASSLPASPAVLAGLGCAACGIVLVLLLLLQWRASPGGGHADLVTVNWDEPVKGLARGRNLLAEPKVRHRRGDIASAARSSRCF